MKGPLALLLFLATTALTRAVSKNLLIHEEGTPGAEALHVVFAANSTLLPDLRMVKMVQKALGVIRTKYPEMKDIKNKGLWEIGKIILSNYNDLGIFYEIKNKFGPLSYLNMVGHKSQQIVTFMTRKPYNSILLARTLEDEFNLTASPEFHKNESTSVQYNPEDHSFNFFKGNHYWTYIYDVDSNNATLDKEDDFDQTSSKPTTAAAVSSPPPTLYQLRNQTMNESTLYASQTEMGVEKDATKSLKAVSIIADIMLHRKNGSIKQISSEELQEMLVKQGEKVKHFDDDQPGRVQTYVELQNETILHVDPKDLEEVLLETEPECGDEVGSKNSDTAINDQEEAEQLVLEQISCNDLLPNPKLVHKIKEDLAKIRKAFPNVQDIRHHGAYELGKIKVIKIADTSVCKTINESRYGPIESIKIYELMRTAMVAREILSFSKSYNPRLLALTLLRDLSVPAKSISKKNCETQPKIRTFKDGNDCVYQFMRRHEPPSDEDHEEYTFKIDSTTGDVMTFDNPFHTAECLLETFTTSDQGSLSQNDF